MRNGQILQPIHTSARCSSEVHFQNVCKVLFLTEPMCIRILLYPRKWNQWHGCNVHPVYPNLCTCDMYHNRAREHGRSVNLQFLQSAPWARISGRSFSSVLSENNVSQKRWAFDRWNTCDLWKSLSTYLLDLGNFGFCIIELSTYCLLSIYNELLVGQFCWCSHE